MACLVVAKRQMIATQAELDGIAERGAADHLDLRAVAKAHFQKATTNLRIAADGGHEAAAADAQCIQATSCGITTVMTPGQIARFMHGSISNRVRTAFDSSIS